MKRESLRAGLMAMLIVVIVCGTAIALSIWTGYSPTYPATDLI